MDEQNTSSWRRYIYRALILFAALVVLNAIWNRHPDRIFIMITTAMAGLGAVSIGWIFANRKGL